MINLFFNRVVDVVVAEIVGGVDVVEVVVLPVAVHVREASLRLRAGR
jgi:hypothetical protein